MNYQTQHTEMPRLTKGNAKISLFTMVENFSEVTGEQVGIIFS